MKSVDMTRFRRGLPPVATTPATSSTAPCPPAQPRNLRELRERKRSFSSFEAGFAEVAKKRRKGANNPKYVLREFKLPPESTEGAEGDYVRPLWQQLQDDEIARRQRLTNRLLKQHDTKEARADERRRKRREEEADFETPEGTGEWEDFGAPFASGGPPGASEAQKSFGVVETVGGRSFRGPRSGGGSGAIADGGGLEDGGSFGGGDHEQMLAERREMSGGGAGGVHAAEQSWADDRSSGERSAPPEERTGPWTIDAASQILDNSAGRIVSINEKSVSKRYDQPTTVTNVPTAPTDPTTNDLMAEELGRVQLAEETSLLLTMRPEHIALQDDLVKANSQARVLHVVERALRANNSFDGVGATSVGSSAGSTARSTLDPVNSATALHRLGKFVTPHGRHMLRDDKTFLALVRLCGEQVELLSTQGVANVGTKDLLLRDFFRKMMMNRVPYFLKKNVFSVVWFSATTSG